MKLPLPLGGITMDLINRLEHVALLFKPTFCRSFIVYGSNIICTSQGAISLAVESNPIVYSLIENDCCITDTHAKIFNPAWQYAFDVIYTVDKCKFYIASYWQFQVILAADRCYKINTNYRYPFNWDKLSEYMVIKAPNSSDVKKWCTLLYGDPLSLMANVWPSADKFVLVEQHLVLEWLKARWLSLGDLPMDELSSIDSTLEELGLTLNDMSFISDLYKVYNVPCGTVSAVTGGYYNLMDNFYNYISDLSIKEE